MMEIKYQKCFVAYLDILGFKEKVKASKDNQGEIRLLLDSLNICNAFAAGEKEVTDDRGRNRIIKIQSRFFSDSMVFFLKEKSSDIGHLFLIVRYVQDRLWEKGLSIRGAITYGDMYLPNGSKERNITLGPEIIKAHYLETKIAIYPRIIVTQGLCRYIKEKNIRAYPFAHEGELSDYIRQDTDGILFIDLLNKNIIRAEDERLENRGNMFSVVWESNGKSKHERIMSNVDACINSYSNCDDEKIKQKYDWLKFYKESIS